MSLAAALLRLPRVILLTLVRGYRLFFSPWVGRSCRFEPTCSRYALEALERHGALGGTVLTTWRLLRCHPLCAGGHDPVPDNPPWSRRRPPPSGSTAPGLFTGLLQRDAAQGRRANDETTLSKKTT
jgi:putative membrane protein insertion efficiency factor